MLFLHPRIKLALVVSIALLMHPTLWAVAQKSQQKPHSSSASSAAAKAPATPSPERDSAITQIIEDVSPQRIQQTDERPISFGTRHTLVVNNPDAANSAQGIVAVRNWIKSEFERISAGCDGCLEVRTDTFVERSTSRLPAAAEVGETYDFGQFSPKLILRRDRYLRGGDRSAFNDSGFPAARFTEHREDYNHQHQNVCAENGIEYGDLV